MIDIMPLLSENVKKAFPYPACFSSKRVGKLY